VSLPSVEFLKDQATRLVTYLGDKHRFRLKPASALEAVAAMYDKHDWNTLHGMAQRNPALASAAAPPSSATYPVTWDARYEPALTVSADDWFRHTLAEGGSALTRRDWLEQQLMAHMQRGAPGVFVNVFGAERAGVRDIYGELSQAGGAGAARALLVNVLAEMEPEEIGAMFVALSFPVGESSADSYWQQAAQRVVAVAARALREVGEAVTLAGLAALFPLQGPPAALELLEARMAAGATKAHLASILLSNTSPHGEFSANTWSAHYGLLARGLARLQGERWTEHFFAGAAASGLYSLLAQGKCLGVEWPDRAGERAGVAVLHALRSAVCKRLQAPREEKQTAWTIALGEVATYIDSPLIGMVEQGRSARVAVLMTARDSGEVGTRPAGQRVLPNVWNTVHLRANPDRLAELLARIGDGPILVQPGKLTAPLQPR
jgi:hypothetical protein